MISAAVQFTHKQHPWLFALPFFGTMGSGWKWFRAVTVRTARRDRHHTHRTRQGYHRRARLAWIRSSLGIPSVWLRVMMCGCFPSQITLSRTIPEGTRGPDFFTSLRLFSSVPQHAQGNMGPRPHFIFPDASKSYRSLVAPCSCGDSPRSMGCDG